MIDYASIAAEAKTAIAEAGREVTIRRIARTVDRVTSAVTPVTTHNGTFTAVTLPAKKANALAGFQTGFDAAYVEKLRLGKVRRVLAAAAGAPFAPQQGDEAEFDGVVWEVLGCTPLAPSGLDVIYQLEVACT